MSIRQPMLLWIVAACLLAPVAARADWARELESPRVQKYALSLSRRSLAYFLANRREMPVPSDVPAALKRRAGVIVTLEKRGQVAPRGCRGTTEPMRESLAREIICNTIATATRDKRVAAVRESELGACLVSLSVIMRVEPMLEKMQTSATPRSSMVFAFPIASPGWFQAVAFADGNPASTASDELTFSVAPRPARRVPVPSLQVSGAEDIAPPGRTEFRASGELLQAATLRAWTLLPSGAQQQVLEQRKPMPPRPEAGTKAAESYEPVIKWSVPLLSAGAYLIEVTSDKGLKRLVYSRASRAAGVRGAPVERRSDSGRGDPRR